MTKTKRNHPLRKTGLVAGILLAFLFPAPSVIHGFSPSDILIVYNPNMEGSQGIAQYYAKERGVPETNLLGVEVTTAESMIRTEFLEQMLPPIRQAAQRLKSAGGNPVLLLIYGVPLRIVEPLETPPDRAFLTFLDGKIKEYGELVLHLTKELDSLTGRTHGPEGTSGPKGKPLNPALERLREGVMAFQAGLHYLAKKREKGGSTEDTARIQSLLIRLGGTDPLVKSALTLMTNGSEKERERIKRQELFQWDGILRQDMMERSFFGVPPAAALEMATIERFLNGLLGELKFWFSLNEVYSKGESAASVDSELALLFADSYQRDGWLPNPFHDRYNRLSFIGSIRERFVKVCRLDGPTKKSVKRLIDDALATEKDGLSGIFYIDARGYEAGEKSAFAQYDRHLINLYDLLVKYSSMKVVIDRTPSLFQPGDCPDAALYCGWYSLSNYVDAFSWNRGAVGFHVASAEAVTLRGTESNAWCKRMIEEGVAATLGPVQEPYLYSFPLPDHFFPLLMRGDIPLLEVYFRTTPFLSWRQILIGDPLYRPFRNHPAIRLPEAGRPGEQEIPEPLPEGNESDQGTP